LNRKKKVNEVISRVKLDLLEDEDDQSINSDSQQHLTMNSIDEARKHILERQI